MVLLEIDHLGVTYPSPAGPITALAPVSWTADRGEVVMVSGPSGSGKTTLLSCLGGILQPTIGSVTVDGLTLRVLSARDLTRYRREKVGIVFQDFNLVPSLSAAENVAVPLWASGVGRRAARRRATELLDQLGLADRLGHRPGELSGGQQQRVAIARALALDPPVLVADEPTANLDVASAEAVIALLRGELNADRVVVLATHDLRLRAIADRVVDLAPRRADLDVDRRELRLDDGDVLFHMGEPSDAVYRVETGAIDLTRPDGDGAETLVRRCVAGEYFGETGPMLGFVRSATARAHGAATVVALSLAEFRREAGAATDGAARPQPAAARRRTRPLVAERR